MCRREATTREHVPPKCFFPEGRNQNLITVPSCEFHNNANSKDVEYVRNVFSMGTGIVGRLHFFEKGIKSFRRSPKLYKSTFEKVTFLQGHERNKVFIKTDTSRIVSILNSICHALYYHDFGKKLKAHWTPIIPSWSYDPAVVPEEIRQIYAFINRKLDRKEFAERTTANPEVFRYWYAQNDYGYHIYRMVFYEEFKIYTITTDKVIEILGKSDFINTSKDS